MTWRAKADLLIVGTGVAGLTAALRARELGMRVLVVGKDAAAVGNTAWAQGGIAVVRQEERDAGDSVRRHVRDTLEAGAGLCDPEAVHGILENGATAMRRLREAGACFDTAEDGTLSRTREGGHSAFRVVHAGGDATGAEVQRALNEATSSEGVPVLEQHCVVELLHTDSGAVGGALVLDDAGRPGTIQAQAVLLATGGIGQLYRSTTNPEVATGDGIALALRAGASVADLEFVQFHPTALRSASGETSGGGRRPLVTEALRGEGAVLVDVHGRRVMRGVHPAEDLAPRDVVAAAIDRRMAATGADSVHLDATCLGAALPERFPTVHAACRAEGIDPVVEPIPVTTAAHYSCGGIVTTVDGRTEVSGLYAAGEVARTGLHGANRLASNSLLEGLVLANRAAEAVQRDLRCAPAARTALGSGALPAAPVVDRAALRAVMSAHAGIERDAAGLAAARERLDEASVVRPLRTRETAEDAALTLTADALLASAVERTESRGCHRRRDHPDTDDRHWRRGNALRLDVSGWLIRSTPGEMRAVA
ncbi:MULTISPECIES: L-aspartate oxidase [unclassified Actinopolyspora]|uniref:L-aspartate oxidase n=1 Tax=unclassified Actinopolyspora TaxID=2639451 RepID=UPI0013F66413|nr:MULTISPECIES: L-aspartate oxidase [unclassified Actinopolyspora]NHD17099.1 L-aspartate oxidase [Actinopolyspora sp. BKK2]NHE76251.1 L-aspartate oxidase [Actinopolyspora sp. BKK1]